MTLKKNLGTPSGKCPTCGINLYGADKKPNKMPCNVGRFRETQIKPEDRLACPFETPEQQNKQDIINPDNIIAGLLGTMHGSD